jgi:hypothetical protein
MSQSSIVELALRNPGWEFRVMHDAGPSVGVHVRVDRTDDDGHIYTDELHLSCATILAARDPDEFVCRALRHLELRMHAVIGGITAATADEDDV